MILVAYTSGKLLVPNKFQVYDTAVIKGANLTKYVRPSRARRIAGRS